MEIGGVERSLLGLLDAIDYQLCDVDLFLYAHTGELMGLVPPQVSLLPEIKQYSYFQKPLKDNFLGRKSIGIAACRSMAKAVTTLKERFRYARGSYMTRAFKYSIPFLPKLHKDYDLAVSFLAPHYCVLEKVIARKKVGWVHTDYSTIETGLDLGLEAPMWEKLDVIAAVSEDVRRTFVSILPQVEDKVLVIENVLSPKFVHDQAKQDVSIEVPQESGVTKLCTVGRFSHAKGLDQAVLACKLLLEQGYNLKWYIIGSGPDVAMIHRMVALNNLSKSFIILGKKVNPYPYMRSCDIYVQPSRYEGKAVTIREAQMLGKPVVITNFPTAGSQLEDGLDGHITPLGAEGIAKGIAEMIDNTEWRDELALCAASRDYGNRSEVNKLYSLF